MVTRAKKSSFEELKRLVSTAPVLKYFDNAQPVTMSVDASSKGMGAVLMQNGQPVAYGSRALNETQSRYAQIEREMLAVLYGCEKFHHYIYGRRVTIETDHKPLVAIHRKPIHRATPRLQRMLMRLQRYDIELVYKPGKEMFISDALSRAFLEETTEQLVDEELSVSVIEAQLPVSEQKLSEIKLATATDPSLQELSHVVTSGWPSNKKAVHSSISPYWSFKDEITVIDGLLYRGYRLIIPDSLKHEMLAKLHEAHLGIVKTKQRAREIIYWPLMNQDIENMIRQCSVCNKYRNANCAEPLMSHDIPSRPWAKVGVDLFEFKGREYLLCVDYFSKYPEIALLQNMSSEATVTALKSIFARHGIPSEVISDNGPQFASHTFHKFAEEWNFTHSTSSPKYPKSNGQAERCVQTVKNLFRKTEDSHGEIYIALLEYRASPIDVINLSPAQLLFNRQLRTKIPISTKLLNSNVSLNMSNMSVNNHEKLCQRQQNQKYYHDQKSHVLPELHDNEIVRMQDNNVWKPAIVINKDSPRSYIVKNSKGKTFRRNRKHLYKSRETSLPVDNENDQVIDESDYSDHVSQQSENKEKSQSTMSSQDNTRQTRSGRVTKRPTYLDDYVE